MAPVHFLQLVLLAAIWGASFLFMRIAVPQIGAVWLLEIRLISAALFVLLVAQWMRQPLELRSNARHYLILGAFNTAIPFFAMAWAATTLSAAVLSVINATAPLWGLIVGFLWRGKAISASAALGLVCGMAGVAAIVGVGQNELGTDEVIAVLGCMIAPICYGIAACYAEHARSLPAFANAHGSIWASVALILPLMAVTPLPEAWPASAVGAALALGVLCSGIAYLLYYHLVSVVGAASALTVGYLIPLFGVTWGWLFLGEEVGLHTIIGAVLVLAGTALVTGMNPLRLLRQQPPTPREAA